MVDHVAISNLQLKIANMEQKFVTHSDLQHHLSMLLKRIEITEKASISWFELEEFNIDRIDFINSCEKKQNEPSCNNVINSDIDYSDIDEYENVNNRLEQTSIDDNPQNSNTTRFTGIAATSGSPPPRYELSDDDEGAQLSEIVVPQMNSEYKHVPVKLPKHTPNLRKTPILDDKKNKVASDVSKKSKKASKTNCMQEMESVSPEMDKSSLQKSIQCQFCDLYVPGKGNLEKHIVAEHTAGVQKSLKCSPCGFTAPSKKALDVHNKSSCFKCSYCEFAASSMDAIQHHIRSEHTTYHPYRCTECNYTAVTKASLDLHSATNHATNTDSSKMTKKETKILNCPQCDFTTSTKSLLRRHFGNEHNDTIPFQCESCNYSSSSEWSIKKHRKETHEQVSFQ